MQMMEFSPEYSDELSTDINKEKLLRDERELTDKYIAKSSVQVTAASDSFQKYQSVLANKPICKVGVFVHKTLGQDRASKNLTLDLCHLPRLTF